MGFMSYLTFRCLGGSEKNYVQSNSEKWAKTAIICGHLFHSGIVFFLLWSILRPLESLGHSSFSQNQSQKIFSPKIFNFSTKSD